MVNVVAQILVMCLAIIMSEGNEVYKCQESQFSLRLSASSSLPQAPSKIMKPFQDFTACFWMKASQEIRDMIVFSYKMTTNNQEISIKTNTTHLTVQIGQNQKVLKPQQIKMADNLLSVCLTWSSHNGQCKLFLNSVLAVKVTDFSKKFIIQAKGNVYLGGRPGQVSERFEGNISRLNIWSRVLPTQVIAVLGQRCGVERGDVISWDTFKNRLGANVDIGQDICPRKSPEFNRANLTHHWSLTGPDSNVGLVYSAVYLEGRYSTTRSLFLDSTKAHAYITPGTNLSGNFTIAFWMSYTSDKPRNATIVSHFDNVNKEFIFKILDDKFVFQRRGKDTADNLVDVVIESPGGFIEKSVWQHVTLVWYDVMTSYYVCLYIDGQMVYKTPSTPSASWVVFSSSRWNLGGTYHSWDFGYFLGYLSDFMVFKRALTDSDIGPLMAVGAPILTTVWNPVLPPPSDPLPTQTSLESWPDIGKCINERPYQPADCLGALLTGKDKVHLDTHSVQLPCDQLTNGGGWMIIGTRTNDISYFGQTIEQYNEGFWENDVKFWLGSQILSSMTRQSLLVEIHTSPHGQVRHALCVSFKVQVINNNTNVNTDECSGYNVPLTSLLDIKNLFVNGSFSKVEMKIRPTKDLPMDYTVFFQQSRPIHANVRVHNITEMSSFTICLWTRLRFRHDGTLFSLVSDDLVCTLSIQSLVNKLNASCTDTSTSVDVDLFDDTWHHICVTWERTKNHITLFIDGAKKSEYRSNKLHVFKQAGFLNLGRHQSNLLERSISTSKDLIGQLGHVDVWDVIKDDSMIRSLSNGPGVEFGNVLTWAIVRAWLPMNTVQVLHPSSCVLQESYSWRFKGSNNTFQVDEKLNSSAHVQGGVIASDETIVIEKQGSIEASDVIMQQRGMSMSFWTRQEVLISSILGDNVGYYNHLKTWLSPIVSHHASWVRCYSSRQHGWYVSSFHRLCDYKGPTLTLIRVKDYVLGGMIDQSWGGSNGFLPSNNSFLFTLHNPHGISPSKFPIKQEHKSFAAHTNQFVGPNFGFNDLVIYEETDGRIACWSSLGTSYAVSNNVNNAAGGRSVFTGSRLFYPDKIEVFYYNMPTSEVPGEAMQRPSPYDDKNCSSASVVGEFSLEWHFTKLETITHIAIKGMPKDQRFVSAFLVEYTTIPGGPWTNTSVEYVSYAKWNRTVHAILPPIYVYKIKVIPTKWNNKICLIANIYKEKKDCGQPFGMENSLQLIPKNQITASSSFKTYAEDDEVEYRWPYRGRLNFNKGSKAWLPDTMNLGDWFQVDLGKISDIRCFALQGRPDKIHYVKEFKIAYSLDGGSWKYALTNYQRKTFKGIEYQTSELITVVPRSVMAKFIRIYTVKCSRYCAMRTEFYGNQSGLMNTTEGLQFSVLHGSNSFAYSTSSKTWKIQNKPQLKQWTHVVITWSLANGINVYYNGTLKEHSSLSGNSGIVSTPARIAVVMAGGMGTMPMKLGDLKVWGQELDQRLAQKDYELVTCDFENDMCLERFQLSPKVTVSWIRTVYCISTNTIGACLNASLTGYCLSLKSLPVYHGQSSRFTSPLLHSTVSCISFSFRIDGNNTGRINVNLIDLNGIKSLLWRRSGNHGGWNKGRIPITQTHSFKIEFEGVVGSDIERHLSIDNITLSVNPCKSLMPRNAVSNASVIKTKIINHVPVHMNAIKEILNSQNIKKTSWTTCYTSRDHGWNVKTFKNRCKSKGPTLALVRHRNTIFGGFTEKNWGQVYTDPDMSSLHFDGQLDYSQVKLQRDIRSFSISLWMQTSTSLLNNIMTLLSTTIGDQLVIEYKPKSSDGEVTVRLHNGVKTVSGLLLHDNKWHHIFVQWQNVQKNLSIYIDGDFKAKKDLDDELLPAGISFILGKKLANTEYYQGKLDRVNIWSNDIGDGIGRLMGRGCGQIYHGDLITWNMFIQGIQENSTVIPSTCPYHKNDTDFDFNFTPTPDKSGYVVIDSTLTDKLQQFTMSWWMKTDSYNDLHMISYMVDNCNTKQHLGISFTRDAANSTWIFVFKCVKKCDNSPQKEQSLHIGASINDGYWHHVAVTWFKDNKDLQVNIDGLPEGTLDLPHDVLEELPRDGKIILGQTPQNDDPDGDPTSNLTFIGRLTDFNMMDYVMSQDALRVMALRCGTVRGNILSWKDARNKAHGNVDVYSPSSCQRKNYRPDPKAFLFVLNDISNSSIVARLHNKHIGTSISIQQSRGLVFGESPHDLIVGINGSMNTAVYRGNVSYGSMDGLKTGTFEVDDIEVLYTKDSLCHNECRYHYNCDEINGGCKCTTADTSFGLCYLEKIIFTNALYYWPLDHPYNVKNLKSKIWGVVKGDVTPIPGVNMGALKTTGDTGSMVVLERFNTSCLKKASKGCDLTVSLWLRYWLINSDKNQTFLDINGLLSVYQPKGTVMQLAAKVFSTDVRFCVNLFNSPAGIWSHYTIVISVLESQIYRNGKHVPIIKRNFTTLSASSLNYPDNGLIRLSPGGAKADYDDLVISGIALDELQIKNTMAAYTDRTNVPVVFSAKLPNETWHTDLSKKDSALYLDLLGRIESNITSFYRSSAAGSIYSIKVDAVSSRQAGSVVCNFTISYYPWSSKSVASLLDKVESTSTLNNLALEDLQVMPVLVPNKPLYVHYDIIANSMTIHVIWTAPNMSDLVHSWFQGYNVYYQKQGELSPVKLVIEGNKTSVIVNDPRPYALLRIWVTAYNIKGESPPSSEVVFSYLNGAPTAIPNIRAAHNTSSTSIYVKWDNSTQADNTTTEGYQVSIYRNSSRVYTVLVNCTEVDLVGLEVFTAYSTMVAAFNAVGRGPYSQPVNCMTDEEAPTGSPSNITTRSTNATELHLVWQPILSSQRNGIIRGYNIVYHLLDDSNLPVSSYFAISDNAEIALTNLRPYSSYRIQIGGFNSKGTGPLINGSFVFKTEQAAPSTYPNLQEATSQRPHSILIKWLEIPKPELNGVLQYYVVHYQEINSPITYLKNVTAASSRRKRRALITHQLLLDGLKTFKNYSIKIAGVTVAQGPYSPARLISTGQDVPGPVINLQATNQSSTSILVTWQPPTITNGIILGYKVNYTDNEGYFSSGSIDTTSTSATVAVLVNYTSYDIRVTAYTIKGEGNVSTTTCKTDEEVPTGPPQSLAAFPASYTSIEIKWRPVPEAQRRGVITKYLIMFYNATSMMILQRELAGDKYSIIIDGLEKQSNYSVKIRAYTRKGHGPFSVLVSVSTNSEAPKFPPANVTAELNATNSILVKWSNLAQGGIRGYRVVYTGVNNPFATENSISVDYFDQEIILKDLFYYTQYMIRVSAFTAFEGNLSQPVYVTTGESVPTHPPTKIVVTSKGSSSISIFWDKIPPGHRNGLIIKYHIAYRRTGTNVSFTIQETDQFSIIISDLEKNTGYDIKISGATSVGYGNSSFHSLLTDEDVPSGIPQNLTAHNWTSLYALPVTWQPVPANQMNGKLTGYYLTYSAIKRGDKDLLYTEVTELPLPPDVTSYTIKNLLPLSVYRIGVVASTGKGVGPKAVTLGETCRCTKTLTTSWSQYHPYVNITKRIPGLIIPVLVNKMTSYCCKFCKEHGRSSVDYQQDGNGSSAEKASLGQLVRTIDGETDFSFPVYGYHDQTVYKGGLGYSPLIMSPGVAFIVHKKDTVKMRENMFNAIIGCWPVLAIPIVMCYIAGFMIWALDSSINPEHYPRSFFRGFANGFWWAFVSMTTVGYGDITPRGKATRIFAVLWTLCGIVIISVCTSTITTSLTEVYAINTKQMLYGSKVAAMQNSPEFWLGKRKNARVNEKKEYHTLQDLIKALDEHEVEGILVDTFAAGSRSDLFNKPHLRIAKVLDYKMAYGLVTAGYAIQLRQCFHEFLTAFTVDIFHNISDNVKKIQFKQDPPEQIITDGLFNTKAEQFKESIKYTGCALVLLVLFGICFDWIRRLRTRAPIKEVRDILTRKQIMKNLVDDFKKNMLNNAQELIKKHSMELRKARRLKSRLNKSKKENSPGQYFKMETLSPKPDHK